MVAIRVEPASKLELPEMLLQGVYFAIKEGCPIEGAPWEIDPDSKGFL